MKKIKNGLSSVFNDKDLIDFGMFGLFGIVILMTIILFGALISHFPIVLGVFIFIGGILKWIFRLIAIFLLLLMVLSMIIVICHIVIWIYAFVKEHWFVN